jgi:hypothetical protein
MDAAQPTILSLPGPARAIEADPGLTVTQAEPSPGKRCELSLIGKPGKHTIVVHY